MIETEPVIFKFSSRGSFDNKFIDKVLEIATFDFLALLYDKSDRLENYIYTQIRKDIKEH